MRISDWSSDVCSSDLACRIALAGFVIPFMAVYAPALMLQPGDPMAAAIGFWPAVAYVVGNAVQIGRASCRARVCQYVSLSVVAVSLKKETTQTINEQVDQIRDIQIYNTTVSE